MDEREPDAEKLSADALKLPGDLEEDDDAAAAVSGGSVKDAAAGVPVVRKVSGARKYGNIE